MSGVGWLKDHDMQHGQLQIIELKKYFPVTKGILLKKPVAWVKALDGVTFSLKKGESLGIVGESGRGKTNLAKLILCLKHPTSGPVG